jgi:TRAP-type mannitol/chloroaromatic compound transport system permease small subunit
MDRRAPTARRDRLPNGNPSPAGKMRDCRAARSMRYAFAVHLAGMSSLLRFLRWFARVADAIVDAVGRIGAWLVLFVVAVLFGQLPLREWVGAGHILANDYGQIAHAAVFMIGVAYAMRWDGHVRLDVFYQRMSRRARLLVDLAGTVFCVVPWIGIVLWFSWATTLRSVAVFEKFPETWSPGYWLFKVLLIVFGVLVSLQALGHIARDVASLVDDEPGTDAPPSPPARAIP